MSHADSTKNLNNVRAFLIERATRAIFKDPLPVIRKLQAGNFLLGVINDIDKKTLLATKTLADVSVSPYVLIKEHSILNSTQVVHRIWNLKGIDDTETAVELKDQNP